MSSWRRESSGTPPGCSRISSSSGGLRCASTSGYHLATLRVAALVVCALWFCAMCAQATAPRLTGLLPTGGQRGTEVEVRFSGQRLGDAQEIVFYGPGLSAGQVEAGKSNVFKATLRIAPDAPLGEHPMRLRTATGVSEVRTFWVGPFPTTNEVEPNSELSKAQKVPLNITVAGSIVSEDVDCFRVSAEAGQRITAELEAMRLGRGVFDAYVAIQDLEGKILAASDDTTLVLQDPIASFLPARSGDYIVQVREASFGGRDDYHYRLHLSTAPRPTAVYPAAGRIGEKLEIKFLGDLKWDPLESTCRHASLSIL